MNWTTFSRRISIKASNEKIFSYWINQKNIQCWFLKEAAFYANGIPLNKETIIHKGNTYKWSWYASENVAEGEILSIIENEQIQMTFLGCHVCVKFYSEADENIVEVIQSQIPTDEESKKNYFVECTRGWTFYLANLKSILEGGIDLRNKNNALQNVINT